ncbi:hypothetical protein ACD591_14450 [Rufibacter glacialis]|uniref:Uncharacterized protein n=1 Tax=Rufibacter glacialis TaxID=1259555 RepID=A0A5M8Q772_9BACT|nr:hypothetical protein [Rufibacter glacialis]KAA6430958.1 hypothetical protein FOE74_17780 [Rufibacter glacialis]GGK82876.1 hypothetical protein GCM10011405_33320 [Rufibacter glacialis]
MSENLFPEMQHLPGLPLTKTTRLGQVQFFHFGKAHIMNASGLVLDVGAWTLEVACHWHLEEAGAVIIRFEDVEIPKDAQALADPAFDPQVPGSNLRDRKLQELVRGQQEPIRVWQITASPEGDLTITLEGNRLLHIQPSQGILEDTAIFWRLFSNPQPSEAVGFGPDGVERT